MKKSLEFYMVLRQFKPMKDLGIFRYSLIFLILSAQFIFSEEKVLYIVHTNNTNGALENCYCPDHPFGAIEKRTVFINKFIKKHSNTVVVDAGDFFSVTQRPFLDSLIIDAYNALPYDAILLGDQELSRENTDKTISRLSFPALSANLKNHKKQGVDSFTVLERGGINVGIVGVIHPNVFRFYPKEIKDRVILEDPIAVIKSFIKKHEKSLDAIIALTHEGYDKDVELAESINELDIIVGSHSQTKLDSGSVVNDCLIVQAGKEGYYVGIITLKFDDKNQLISSSSRLETMTFDLPDDPYIMELISAYETKTGHVNRNKLKHQKGKK